jgi:hypothetical protein
MTKDIPMIAHMIFINDVILNSEGKQYDITANDKAITTRIMTAIPITARIPLLGIR